MYKQRAVVKVLLEHGSNINERAGKKEEYDTLEFARLNGCASIVRLLEEHAQEQKKDESHVVCAWALALQKLALEQNNNNK
jgi:hypothetical protein